MKLDMHSIKLSNSLVFLDFDGCVNNMHNDIGSYLNHPPSKYGMSKVNVERLISLCVETSSKIVISSNWRRFDDNDYWQFRGEFYKNPLPVLRKRLNAFIVDELPKHRHMTKSQALDIWMKETGYNGRFVIFDDDLKEKFDSHPIFKRHFIHCDERFGITKEDVDEAIEILAQN